MYPKIKREQETDRPLNKVNAGLQVQPKINEAPLNAFSLVLLLLQDEHGMVEELLQLLISVVDTQLLKWVQLKGSGRLMKGVMVEWKCRVDMVKCLNLL